MSALVVDLSNHRAANVEGAGGAAVVEQYEGLVHLTLRAEDANDNGGCGVDRTMTADEARSLAAALYHFAREVER